MESNKDLNMATLHCFCIVAKRKFKQVLQPVGFQ